MIKLLVIFWSFWKISASLEPCTTPNGENALCQPLADCEILLQALTSKDTTVKKFFDASKCGDFMVCCGTSANYTERPKQPHGPNETSSITTKEAHRAYVLEKLLPSRRICGQQHFDDYQHSYTEKSQLDEFPWLVYIEKKNVMELDGIENEFKCVGTIISSRYIITNDECAGDDALLENIKLGLYNRFNDTDCIESEYGQECINPPVHVEMEEKLSFPDIGLILIRLKKRIQYTDYIRPICLPLNETIRPKVSDTVISSGWGDFPSGGVLTAIKKKFVYTLDDPPKELKNNSGGLLFLKVFNTSRTKDQKYGYDCSGDEGGPLMYKSGDWNWYIEGLISLNSCLGVPLWRLSRASIEWIIDNMRP